MDKEFKQFLKKLRFPFFAVALLWIVKIYEVYSGHRLTRFGIYPREIDGIKGIVTGPFVHSDWKHLISNSFPIFILTTIIVIFYEKVAISAYVFITLFTGILVWLFARESYHIGASGVVYGLVFFVFASGIFRRNVRSIVLALLVLSIYSGFLEGFVPKEGVSWESHLLGAISGVFFAFAVKNIKEDGEEEEITQAEPTNRTYFLPRNIFEKTKAQRLAEQMAREQELREQYLREQAERVEQLRRIQEEQQRNTEQ